MKISQKQQKLGKDRKFMHHNYELLHWESGSYSSYAQISLLVRGFCVIMRSPKMGLDSLSNYM